MGLQVWPGLLRVQSSQAPAGAESRSRGWDRRSGACEERLRRLPWLQGQVSAEWLRPSTDAQGPCAQKPVKSACSAWLSTNSWLRGGRSCSSKFEVSSGPATAGRMGAGRLRCRRAWKSTERNQGWLLMSLMPPAKQPYRLLRSTCSASGTVQLAGVRGSWLAGWQQLSQASSTPGLFPATPGVSQQAYLPPTLSLPTLPRTLPPHPQAAGALTCSSFLIRSRTVTLKWLGKMRLPLRIFLYVPSGSSS